MNANRQSYWARRSYEGKLMARESNRVQDEKRRTRPVPDDTLLMRAKSDTKTRANGKVLREGFSFVDGEMKPWRIVRSVAGRINQVDLVIDNSLWRTGSERAATSAIKYGKWPCY